MKRLVLPCHTNSHRPFLLQIRGLLTLSFGLLFVFLYYPRILSFTSLPVVLGETTTNLSAKAIIDLTNRVRIGRGLKPLVVSPQLTQAAYLKARDMLANNYWAHQRPSGEPPWVFLDQAGYSYQFAGENLAKNFNQPEALIKAWLRSPLHKQNLLDDKYREIGVAVVRGRLQGVETNLVVQFLATPMPGQDQVLIKQVLAAPSLDESDLLPKPQDKSPPVVVRADSFKREFVFLITLLLLLAAAADVYYVERFIPRRFHSYSRLHFIFLLIIFGLILVIHPDGLVK